MKRIINVGPLSVTVDDAYAAGHVIGEAEAFALNQTRVENLRNNLNTRYKAMQKKFGEEIPEHELEALLAEFQTYILNYVFQIKRSSSATIVDPVEKEARKIAKGLLVAALKGKGKSIKDLDESTIDKHLATILERRPDVMEEAKRRVAAANSFASSILDDEEDAVI